MDYRHSDFGARLRFARGKRSGFVSSVRPRALVRQQGQFRSRHTRRRARPWHWLRSPQTALAAGKWSHGCPFQPRCRHRSRHRTGEQSRGPATGQVLSLCAPISFVVKNGSKIRGRMSGYPTPVSPTVSATKSPCRSLPWSPRRSFTLCAVTEITPPRGVASRALTARVDQRELELAEVDPHGPDLGRDANHELLRRQRAGEHVSQSVHTLPEVDPAGIEPLTPRKGEQLPGQRLSALRGAGDGLRPRAGPWDRRRRARACRYDRSRSSADC